MVTHQPKDGHPPGGSVLQTWNLEPRLNSQNQDQVTTAMDGLVRQDPQPPFKGWSPNIKTIVTHLPKDGHPANIGWSPTIPGMSPTIPKMVTHNPQNAHPPFGT